MNGDEFLKTSKRSIVLPQGWMYRDYINLKKHQQRVRSFFTPLKQYVQQIDAEIETARQKGDVIIGIHIRRKDYKTFFDGKWYYENDVYKAKMKAMEDLFVGKKCVFVICSDEIINKLDFSDFITLIKKRTPIVDLYLLAECDYIIGPPSTYSAWASFYKNVPISYIDTADQVINMDSFKSFI